MKKRFLSHIISIISVMLASCLWVTPVMAGSRSTASEISKDSETLDDIAWHATDENIVYEKGKLYIQPEGSNSYTKLVAKTAATRGIGSKDMISVSTSLRLTALPAGEQFIVAFGLVNIEASSGEPGNVEVVFTNENGIFVSVVAYDENGVTTIMEKQKCGVSLNSQFSLSASINTTGTFTLKINNKEICNKELSVSGEGRFGILQTGSCGAVVSKLTVNNYYYDRPENVNIVEDFEDGEFDASVLKALTLGTSDYYPQGMFIEEYKGNKVLMFRNTSTAYFGTMCEYSNFEVSFDIPYYLHEAVVDENGIALKETPYIGLGFGEIMCYPSTSTAYEEDIDLIIFGADYAKSNLKKTWTQKYEELGVDFCGDRTKNQGYSVKITVIDGDMVFQAKALSDTKWTTVTKQHYDDFRTGYIYLWSLKSSNFAIDNFKLTNLDEEANVIETEYKSSILELKDYELTEEDTKMVFKEKKATVGEAKDNSARVIVISSSIGIVVLVVLVIVLVVKKKRKQRIGGTINEKE